MVPASGNQRLAQTLLEVCFYHFNLNCAQGETFSGLVVRKVNLNSAAPILKEEKELRLK